MFEKLRELRNSKNISAEEMASMLGLETKAAYYKKEAGNVKFTLVEAKKISDFLNLPIEKIFFTNEVSLKDTGETG